MPSSNFHISSPSPSPLNIGEACDRQYASWLPMNTWQMIDCSVMPTLNHTASNLQPQSCNEGPGHSIISCLEVFRAFCMSACHILVGHLCPPFPLEFLLSGGMFIAEVQTLWTFCGWSGRMSVTCRCRSTVPSMGTYYCSILLSEEDSYRICFPCFAVVFTRFGKYRQLASMHHMSHTQSKYRTYDMQLQV